MIALATTIVPAARSLTITPAGQAQFRFPYNPPLQAELKEAIPGVTWNGTLRAWTIRTKPANIRAIGAFARARDFAGIEHADLAKQRLFAEVREKMMSSQAAESDFVPPSSLRGLLRPFQRAGVAYAVKARRCLIADEMGLGKTVEALAALETLQSFPAVVVCPASLRYNWQRELTEWLPGVAAPVIITRPQCNDVTNIPKDDGTEETITLVDPESGPSALLDLAQRRKLVLILSYDLLAAWLPILTRLRLQAVVFDEGHLLKDHRAQRSIAARRLRQYIPIRFILTGTPLLNRVSDLLSLLQILGTLGDLGGFEYFVERYCGGHKKKVKVRGGEEREVLDMSGASNLPELAGRLRATCMVRRRKRDVLPELPAKQLSLLPVEIDTRAEYDLAQQDVLRWIARRAGRDPEFRTAIAHLSPEHQLGAVLARAQAAADKSAQAEELVRMTALRQISARGKVAAAEEWITNFLLTGEKLVVFAWHQEVLADLAARFPGTPVIDGDTPQRDRQRIVDEFQGLSRKVVHPLVLLNLQAGGVGLTLTAASNVLALELPWTPALLDQAIDRLHRIGQVNAVNAWLMMGRRTLDYPIWKLLQKKRQTTEAATR